LWKSCLRVFSPDLNRMASLFPCSFQGSLPLPMRVQLFRCTLSMEFHADEIQGIQFKASHTQSKSISDSTESLQIPLVRAHVAPIFPTLECNVGCSPAQVDSIVHWLASPAARSQLLREMVPAVHVARTCASMRQFRPPRAVNCSRVSVK
jgi:hypothetical protein